MKNIHVLQTDKPSRLSIINSQLIYSKEYFINAQHIYITSDEDINQNDYIITKDGRLVQVSYLLSKDLQSASKVILTTDQDLIKDEVQAIDDEFLEWFVKNPSCEEVKVELHVGSLRWSDSKNTYKIIIPKEEVLLQSSIDGEPILGEAPKQETLEEAAEKYNSQFIGQNEFAIEDFKNGAKWQQEQDKKLYSEEDLKEAFAMGRTNATIKDFNTKFKKK
jgi:hypothetical protein